MEPHDKSLSQPLLPTTTSAAAKTRQTLSTSPANHNHVAVLETLSANSTIFVRLLFIALIGALSILANHQASKGFDITIVNEAKESPTGRRFELFYVSNDRATRIVLEASDFAEKFLYPDHSFPKKKVLHVKLKLARRNLTQTVQISSAEDHNYVVDLSPSLMEVTDANHAMEAALRRAMARMWLWGDKTSNIPLPLLDGMVEYITTMDGFGHGRYSGSSMRQRYTGFWWEDENPMVVAGFLNYCEEQEKGYVQRLNQALRGRWSSVEVIRVSSRDLCASFRINSGK